MRLFTCIVYFKNWQGSIPNFRQFVSHRKPHSISSIKFLDMCNYLVLVDMLLIEFFAVKLHRERAGIIDG